MKDLIRKVILEYTEEVKEGKRYTDFQMNDDSFARLFYFFLTELKENTGFSRAKMYKGFERSIRHWSEKPPELISKRVIDYFIDNHPNKNPFKSNFRPRDKYGIPVIFEHTTPVKVFITKLFETQTIEDVRRAMDEFSGLSIITVEEDKCLFSKGFSRSRPQGWRQSYRECDIEIMTEDEFNRYKSEKLNSLPELIPSMTPKLKEIQELSNIDYNRKPGIIYKITFINDKIYIGSDIQKDLECYHSFYCGSFDEQYVFNDLKKYGYDGVGLPYKNKERLFYSDNITRGELIKIENQFIKEYNSDIISVGYNKPKTKKR